MKNVSSAAGQLPIHLLNRPIYTQNSFRKVSDRTSAPFGSCLCWEYNSSTADNTMAPSLLKNIQSNGVKYEVVQMDIESDSEIQARFPKEPKKLFISFIMLFIAAICNDGVLAFIHERVPETEPLPDLIFSHVQHVPIALPISEYLLIFSVAATILTCLLHKHRWILFRRLFFVTSLLYIGRSICMLVTQVPVADPSYNCWPKVNHTSFGTWAWRTVRLVSGGGLSINGMHTLCGDYIYSGHTVVLVISYLMVKEYSPRRFYVAHWLTWLVAAAGVLCLLLSRGHYTIDIILAYYFTTRLFWTYHSMANIPALRDESNANLLSRACWFRVFCFFEANSLGPVPKNFEWPLPWPKCLKRLGMRTKR